MLRPKGSSFHSKKDFKFQANVNFQLDNEPLSQERPRVLTIQTRKTNESARSTSVKRQDTSQSEANPTNSNISFENEPKFQQINIFSRTSNFGNNNGNIPASPKTPRKKITLKKSLSSQRPSILSIFSKIKKKTNLDLSDEEDFKCIIAILRKPPYQRTDHEIVLLKSAFEDVKFFEERKNELSLDCYNRLYRELKHESIETRRTVFNLGDMGRNFYIIIQGTVSILLKKQGLEENPDEKFSRKHEETQGNEENREQIVENKRDKNLLRKIQQYENENSADAGLRAEVLQISDEDFLKLRYPSFFMMRKMRSGEAFGEIALRQNVPRTGTILCDVDCHFAILTRDAYQTILKSYDDQIINEKIDFLISLPIFKGWSPSSMEQLFKQFRVETFRKDTVLYKENDVSSCLYFIRDGEVELTKYIILDENLTKKRASLHKTDSFLPSVKQAFENNRQRVRIALLGPNSMFGQEEILMKSRRKSKAVCVSSKTTVFYIQKDAFFNFVKNYNTVKILEKINNLNKDWRESLSTSIQSSFLKGKPQEKRALLPYIKGISHRKSVSETNLKEKTEKSADLKGIFKENLKENADFSRKWLAKKLTSKEINSERSKRNFKGSHTNEFIESFNEFYEKIEVKHDDLSHSFGFNNAIIDNPFAKHILEMKLRQTRGKHKKSSGFGRYLSEEIKRKIQENYNNNSFFSMNFCRNVVKKKPDLLEKTLLQRINQRK